MSRTLERLPEVMQAIAELRADVSALKERQKIQDVYIRYGRGIDRLDEKSYFSAFWPDAQINYGTAESISAIEHWTNHMQQGFKEGVNAWAHLLTNLAVEVEGDVAHVEIYLTVIAVHKDSSQAPFNIWAGRYIDRLDRRNGEWRIAVREYMPHFATKVDTSAHDRFLTWFYKDAKPGSIQEHWSKQDPSYARPLNRRAREAGPFRAT